LTRYLLDTNVVSDTVKLRPSQQLESWFSDQLDETLFISTITLAEVRRGVLKAPEGRRKRELEAWFSGSKGPEALFAGRVLAFDPPAALLWAELMYAGDLARRSRSPLDTLTAAIALVNGCVVVTDNERHFAGVVEIINPLRGRTS
jgi:predicted nucleic acid-binding protein